MGNVSKELHDKLYDLRLKLQFAKMAGEDTSTLEEQIKSVRKAIAEEASNKLDEVNKKGN